MTNFELVFNIKDVQNQNQQHPLKEFNTCEFKNINKCGLSYDVY
jgi:hypothetical protein